MTFTEKIERVETIVSRGKIAAEACAALNFYSFVINRA